MKHNDFIIICLLGLFVFYYYLKSGGVGEEDVITEDFSVKTLDNGVLLSVPDNPDLDTSNQVVMIISGMYRANPSWMLNQVPMDIKNSRYVAVSPYQNPVNEAIKIMQYGMIDETGMEAGISSISGFSAGGSQLMNYYQQNNFATVLLLDPALSEVQSEVDLGHEVIFLYGSDLHDSYTTYADEYDRLHLEAIASGSIVEDINTGHYEFPKYGFEKYRHLL